MAGDDQRRQRRGAVGPLDLGRVPALVRPVRLMTLAEVGGGRRLHTADQRQRGPERGEGEIDRLRQRRRLARRTVAVVHVARRRTAAGDALHPRGARSAAGHPHPVAAGGEQGGVLENHLDPASQLRPVEEVGDPHGGDQRCDGKRRRLKTQRLQMKSAGAVSRP